MSVGPLEKFLLRWSSHFISPELCLGSMAGGPRNPDEWSSSFIAIA
jgi:hypothetical protein